MSNEMETDVSTEPNTEPGPDLLTERTLGGIFVHFIGLATWFVGTGVLYLVSEREFTRTNARNATNWQLLFVTVFFGSIAFWAVPFVYDAVFPDPLVFDALIFASIVAIMITSIVTFVIFLLNIIFSLFAVGKAIFGTAWEYPLAPDVVGWVRSRQSGSTNWWRFVAVYALTVPLVLAYFAWLLTNGTEPTPVFFAGFFLLVFAMIASAFGLAALFRDARALESADATWQPNWIPYVVVPIGASAVTYVLARVALHSENPSGDAIYGFMFTLWIAAVGYLFKRYRRLGSREFK
ncbi:DUF4870 domain-containing protein [Halostagnicola sp. A-GB9-2]|uniref:DUF4870 domain-containing protein n=1 Tax=Halostagnicola sp. A-GB9-2 TaxID=3048066 RepID=UPI0024C09E2A|nr:DUF4870 domain-containing protein [Halostagnicola sp. A-GB9-2]MDJ1433133.1 DUF4870 domain-containing protein [Halostagnicola sp. A-GB9-2]